MVPGGGSSGKNGEVFNTGIQFQIRSCMGESSIYRAQGK